MISGIFRSLFYFKLSFAQKQKLESENKTHNPIMYV